MVNTNSFDVIVVGAGHAGCEAAAAAARMGAKTALITHNPERIGEMSCNPAIGGLGKGHLVREIDALDGLMGRAIDKAGMQFRVLNRSKGAAVQGPRAQADRKLYRMAMQELINNQQNLTVMEGAVGQLLFTNKKAVSGVKLENGTDIIAKSVVVTSGTFLRGVMHEGMARRQGGRVGDPASVDLAENLQALSLPMGRLKTGTPARLNAKTINFSILQEQPGDDDPQPFSYLTTEITQEQRPCHITYTTAETHQIIANNLNKGALYGGQITGQGPRYCPSIEDKVVKFPDRDRHQVFLEPEGYDDPNTYPNGMSTSLPADIQLAFFKSMPGLENVEMFRPGYAIEYDFIDPRALSPSLQLRDLPGLFLAGQIIGTTGYEEAGALGLVAGINAAAFADGLDSWTPGRHEAYTGVMIDDLVTRGVDEPYRMFTSRAEYRLHLRADNADQRLTEVGYNIGVVQHKRQDLYKMKMKEVEQLRQYLTSHRLSPHEARRHGMQVNDDGQKRDALQLLSLSKTTWQMLSATWPDIKNYSDEAKNILKTDSAYSGYLDRQQADIKAYQKDEALTLPSQIDYSAIGGLSNEMREKLSRAQPATLGAASRIPGVTPAAITALLRHVKRKGAA